MPRALPRFLLALVAGSLPVTAGFADEPPSVAPAPAVGGDVPQPTSAAPPTPVPTPGTLGPMRSPPTPTPEQAACLACALGVEQNLVSALAQVRRHSVSVLNLRKDRQGNLAMAGVGSGVL